jgi:REP element-mobilizing transposase RayT
MARAKRHFIPECIWHITHCCHKKEFLFKFDKDKKGFGSNFQLTLVKKITTKK